MIISTTSQLEGRPVAEYLGVVSAESVQGSTSCAIFYTLSRRLRRPFADPGRRAALAREQATEELQARARQLQADAVLGGTSRSACRRCRAAWSWCSQPARRCA
jgi:uncharacterized protein YbjQ (UPF0145 family)